MRAEYLDFLNNHIEFENIELDSFEKFGTTILEKLSNPNLKELAELYNF